MALIPLSEQTFNNTDTGDQNSLSGTFSQNSPPVKINQFYTQEKLISGAFKINNKSKLVKIKSLAEHSGVQKLKERTIRETHLKTLEKMNQMSPTSTIGKQTEF